MSAPLRAVAKHQPPDFDEIDQSVKLAVACGAPPAMVLAVALAGAAPSSVNDAIDFVRSYAPRLSDLATNPSSLDRLAELEPALQFSPELARVRADLNDHELRGKLVFRDLVGKRSFFQVAALAIGGLEISPNDASLLEHLGVNTQLADVGIWPLAVTRRTTVRSGLVHGVLAGIASLLNPRMAAAPVGAFMRRLDQLEAGERRGVSVVSQLDEAIARHERLPGVGRPALGPDERNAQVVDLARRHGRDKGRSWGLAWEIDAYFQRTKRQNINSAGLQGALMRDIGFSPAAATAFSVMYFAVPVLAHAAIGEEQRNR